MQGEQFPAKFGRIAFRRNFPFGGAGIIGPSRWRYMSFKKVPIGWSSQLSPVIS